MRKTHALAIGALALATLSVASAGAAVVYDGFDYPTGKLAGNTNPTAPATSNGFTDTNTWTKTGTASNDPDVIAGSLSYPGLAPSVGNMVQLTGAGGANQTASRIAIPDNPTGSTIYYSMILQVPTGVTNYGTSTTSGSFFTGLQYVPDNINPASPEGMDAGTNSSAAPLTVHKDIAGDGYNLGIAFRDLAGARVFDTTKYVAGDTLFLVGKYVIGSGDHDDVASLYINPDLSTGTEPGAATVVSANSAGSGIYDYFFNNSSGLQLENNIRSFILRSNGVEPANMNIDELRIGNSWADVTAVPEPASLGLLALGGVAMLARRRRIN